MSFRIIFKKHSIMLSIRNSAADEILGNFTCKIASGEWSDFFSLGLIDKPDDALVELANTFLNRYSKSEFQHSKLLAYSEITKKYNADSRNYSVCRKVLPTEKKGGKPVIADGYTVDSLKDLIFLEMLYAAEQNMHISRCKNCGKYYSSANAGADYCDRIYKDDKTCKWVGAKKSYTKNLMADDALVLYEKIYQALQYRKRKATTEEEEKQLSFTLSALRGIRAYYKKGELTADDFIKTLKKYK